MKTQSVNQWSDRLGVFGLSLRRQVRTSLEGVAIHLRIIAGKEPTGPLVRTFMTLTLPLLPALAMGRIFAGSLLAVDEAITS